MSRECDFPNFSSVDCRFSHLRDDNETGVRFYVTRVAATPRTHPSNFHPARSTGTEPSTDVERASRPRPGHFQFAARIVFQPRRRRIRAVRYNGITQLEQNTSRLRNLSNPPRLRLKPFPSR